MALTKLTQWTRRLPFAMPAPPAQAAARAMKVLRVVAWVVLAIAMIVPAVQLQTRTLRNARKAAAWEARRAAGKLSEKQLAKGPPKGYQGAVNRWRAACAAFWAGRNIYLTPAQRQAALDAGRTDAAGEVALHPNMPFTVILLSPFAALPLAAGGLVFTLGKLLAVAVAIGLVVAVVNHRQHRMPDWLVGLGVLWWITRLISDVQHANTNGFVLALIALQLWWFRKGRDVLAGAALAAAICVKMTPALFLLYWVYQRRWKLVVATVLAGVLFAGVIPAVALGPARAAELTRTWAENLILKGLGGSWYPVHINQSLHGTIGRYLLGGQQGGDINWNPDDHPDYDEYVRKGQALGDRTMTPEWIAVAHMAPATVKRVIQAAQCVVVALLAWAIGWRNLPRDDGRRALHYGLIVTAMLLLNQRSWGHHAVPLLVAMLAIWYGIEFGRLGRAVRVAAFVLMLAVGLLTVATTGEMRKLTGKLAGAADPELWANRAEAYGPDTLIFLLLLALGVLLAVGLKDRDTPYADVRQPLRTRRGGPTP